MARECRAGISAVPRFEFFGRQRLEKFLGEAALDQPGLAFAASGTSLATGLPVLAITSNDPT